MPTILNKSDSANPNVVVNDGQLNTNSTSLTFLGKNYPQGYSQPIGENFLHLLENFASSAEPINPIQGQLWFNNNNDVETDTSADDSNNYGLKIFDGQKWLPIGIVKKFAQPPNSIGSTNLKTGDLFVDTERQQLYISNGTDFTLVGPSFNAAEKTGAEIEYIIDAETNESRPVLSMFVKTKRVAIISDYQFTPKVFIPGFRQIKQGINLSTTNLNTTTNQTKFWGIAEKAEALISGEEIVSTSNFIRSDQNSTTNFSFNVRNNNGISIGNDLSFNLGTDTTGSYIYNKVDGASIDLRLRQSAQIKTILRISTTANNTGAVGVNNLVPEESLDVIGNIKTTDRFISTSNLANSITTNGGINVVGAAIIGGSLTVGANTSTKTIEPDQDSLRSLGSINKRWDTIYALKLGTNTRPATLTGSVIGDVNGNVSGTAGGFQNPVTLNFIGDVQGSVSIRNSGESKNVTLELNDSLISTKELTTLFLNTDLLLVERSTNQGPKLYKIPKTTLAEQLPLVPIGTIILYGGNSGNLPNGYLVCDGQEISRNTYDKLFDVIGYTYKPYNQLIGPTVNLQTFALPDITPVTTNSTISPPPLLTYIIYTGRLV